MTAVAVRRVSAEVAEAVVSTIRGCPFASEDEKENGIDDETLEEARSAYLAIFRASIFEPNFNFGFGQFGLRSNFFAKVHVRIQIIGECHLQMLQLTGSKMCA